MSIIIKDLDEIYTINKENKIINNGYIFIEKNIIKKIGKMNDYDKTYEKKANNVIEASGMIAIPGLINTHTHAAMTLLRGFADDLPLEDWLEEKIWPFESRLRDDDFFWGSKMAILEMIKSGTTTFSDMYFHMDRTAAAVKETGIRAVLSEGLIEKNDGEEGLKNAVDFAKHWEGNANGRITTMLAPHSPYTCSTEYIKKIVNYAKKYEFPLHIHLAETKNELKILKEQENKTPTEYLYDIGLFSTKVLAAHCVYLNDEDIKILANNNVGVAYNPLSNMKLGSGIANIKKMLKKGIKVAFGTDGVASNNNLDLLEEAKIGAYLQKVNNLDPSLLDVNDLLKMLTFDAANILNLKNLGKIKNDFLADIVLVNTNKYSYSYPHHNNLSNLLYSSCSRSVDTVIIDGNIILENGIFKNVNENKVFAEIEKRSKELA